MSKSKIRKDKQCQNCRRFVEERFCPNCGQENVETRRHFHYLFVHFFEDFIHYDGMFWKTMKSLMFSPAKLTKEYLAGKRKSQVNPVQLYIFLSFVAFFLPAILPDFNSTKHHSAKIEFAEGFDEGSKKANGIFTDDGEFVNIKGVSIFGLTQVKSIEELDSIQQTLPQEKKLSVIKTAIFKRILALRQMKDAKEKIRESVIHNFPKAIFLYMPIFAFWLWLFHSKKKWLYFDHGIYTLHYFSFMLLFISLYILVTWIFSIYKGFKGFPSWIEVSITTAMFIYFIYYFFHSHRLMYKERKAVSRLLCTALFFINTFCIIIFLTLYVLVVIWVSAVV